MQSSGGIILGSESVVQKGGRKRGSAEAADDACLIAAKGIWSRWIDKPFVCDENDWAQAIARQ